MHEFASRRLGMLVTLDADLEQEFSDRLRESSTLAVRVAYSVLRQRQDAEEVAQEAFAKAYSRFSQLRDRNAFRAWLVRTTWRLAIDRWRSDKRRAVREHGSFERRAVREHGSFEQRAVREHKGMPEAMDRTAEAIAETNQRAERLWRAIDDLPDKLREAIVLSAIQGYDIREAALLLGVPEGTVKSRLFLARKGLAQRLQCLVNDTRTR